MHKVYEHLSQSLAVRIQKESWKHIQGEKRELSENWLLIPPFIPASHQRANGTPSFRKYLAIHCIRPENIVFEYGGATFGAFDHEAETHPKDLIDENSVEMKPVEFMTLCDRVKSKAAKGYFDSIEKTKGGAEIVYREAWSVLQKLAGDDW